MNDQHGRKQRESKEKDIIQSEVQVAFVATIAGAIAKQQICELTSHKYVIAHKLHVSRPVPVILIFA